MAYNKEEAPIVISKYHRDLLKVVADNQHRTMKATMELLIADAAKTTPRIETLA